MIKPSSLVGGIDEVGYGAWAGPIISVVAVFNEKTRSLLPSGVKDSKKTTEKHRASTFQAIIAACEDVGIGHAWPWEIDTAGVPAALQLCYSRALDDLIRKPNTLIVDGDNPVGVFSGTQVVEPKADVNHIEVSAASMIAKHFRDRIMIDYARQFPAYHFDGNKGYGSSDHEAAIHKHGLLINNEDHSKYIHRWRYCRKAMGRKP
jgi:ribonuclease HII